MKETILITGASGFVGFHLAELLLKKGYEPDWLYDEESIKKAATDHETEYCVVTGKGVEAFAKLLVKDI